jgi:hypothetical protein
MQEEYELIFEVVKEIKIIAIELEDKPELTYDLIKFLNIRSKDLKSLNIEDITNLIMEAKKVLVKNQLMQNIEHKVYELIMETTTFKKIFKEVISYGFPNLWDGAEDLYTEKNY